MSSKKILNLPPCAPFPIAAWRGKILPEEWTACLDAWISLAEAHLGLPNPEFSRISIQDPSLSLFLTSYMKEAVISFEAIAQKERLRTKRLRKFLLFLTNRLLESDSPPSSLLEWGFLADFCKVYGKKETQEIVSTVWKRSPKPLETSLQPEKELLVQGLEEGLNGDLKRLEANLKRLNHLLHASPDTSLFFITGSDFLDGLITCYKLMNPPLRKAIITTTYLCLIGLSEGEKPRFPLLVDQLYALKGAAEAHKAGPTNVNDSLVAELVTVTPVLKQLQHRLESSGAITNRAKSVIVALGEFKKAGGAVRPKRLIRRKVNKWKGVGNGNASEDEGEVHVHKMSLISQIQDIFPDLGSGFLVKLLNEYHDNVEQVTAHLLEDSLPPHLQNLDRSESLPTPSHQPSAPDLAPHSTPPLLPTRRNIYDDDDFDRLEISSLSRLNYGRHTTSKTTEDILADRTTAPSHAAILSALAAFDADDDERDDTYDVSDVGGTVDAIANPEAESNLGTKSDANEEVLFKAWKENQGAFASDAATRRGPARRRLKETTRLTDEVLEGWATMLGRDPRRARALETKFSQFDGEQGHLKSSKWTASGTENEEDPDIRGSGSGSGPAAGFRGRGGGGRGGGHGGRGRGAGGNSAVAGPSGEKEIEEARRRKEATKSRAANHNRKNQRGKKMARGGFPG